MESVIVIPGEILNQPWFEDNHARMIYLHLVLRAWKHYFVCENPSQDSAVVKTTYKKLATETGLSFQQVRTSLQKLREFNEIEINSSPQFTFITLNWCTKYWNQQTSNTPSNKLGNKRTTKHESTKSADKHLTKSMLEKVEKQTSNTPSNKLGNAQTTKGTVGERTDLETKSVEEDPMESIRQVIDCLNILAGTHYTYRNKLFNQLILGRLHDGFTVQDLQTVIKKKCDDWIGTEWEKYLTPGTLFRPSKFESYLNARIIKNEETGGMVF